MHRVKLTKSELQSLRKLFKTTEDRRLRDRCQAVLMVSRSHPRWQIAQDLEIDNRTLGRWLEAYRNGGIEGLKIQWAPGQESLIPKTLAPEIVGWVKGGPAGCGLKRANWTYGELATYLFKRKGIKVATSTMREFCVKHNIRPYRPTYDYRKGDKDAQAEAREDIDDYKKKPSKMK